MLVVLSILAGLSAAAEPTRSACRERAREVDTRFLAGDVEGAWRLAEEHGSACGGRVAGPPGRLRRETNDEERDAAELLAAAERDVLQNLVRRGPGHPDVVDSFAHLGRLYFDAGDYERALPNWERAASEAVAAFGADDPETATHVGNLASVLDELGRNEEGRALHERALAILESALGPEHPDTLLAVNNLAVNAWELGRLDLARPLLERALAGREAALGPRHPDTAEAYANLAALADSMGHYEAALPWHERALAIREEVLGPMHPDLAVSLQSLADHHREAGRYELAVPLLERALAISEEALGPDHPDTAGVANLLAMVHAELGRFDLALPLAERALATRERRLGPDHPSVATSLNDLAWLTKRLGEPERAVDLYRRSLAISERVHGPDHRSVATTLNNLGALLTGIDRAAEALPLLERALAARERAFGPDHPAVANASSNLAKACFALGDDARAAALMERALAITERAQGPEHPAVAGLAADLARHYADHGDLVRARASIDRALPVALSTQEFIARRGTFLAAMRVAAADGRLAEAALWGKLAVSGVEDARAGLADLDESVAAGFLDHHGWMYRELADVLVRQGRLVEAEEVLGLLKADEHWRFTRGSATSGEGLTLTTPERDASQRLQGAPTLGASEARELDALRRASLRETLPPEALARLEELGRQRDAHQRDLEATLVALRAGLAEAGRSQVTAQLGLERSARIRRALGGAPPGTVVLHVVQLPDELMLLVTTPEVQSAVRVPAHAEQVNREVAALREALMDPASDPRPAARALYDRVLRPVEPLLEDAGARTLLTFLDGTLRYVPVAALHDGERYAAERWSTAVWTPAAEGDLARVAADDPVVAAFGTSLSHEVGAERFSALAGVPSELDAVVRERPDDPGAVPGRRWLDGDFTRAALADALAAGTPWVHVASHFRFTPGTEADSYLLLGDGTALTVEDLRLGDFPLVDVDLLALSACETAMSGAGADGSEVEGLAVVAQNQGAAAVLATLWPVADASTAAWMASFYAGQAAAPTTLAEAVALVQRGFLAGEIRPGALPPAARGLVVAAESPAAAPQGWTHPYY